MSDFSLQIKVRNARLLKAMRANGLSSGADLARAAGISVSSACEMIGLKKAPINKRTGDYKQDAIAVCDALQVMPDKIWPHQVRDYIAPDKPSEIEVAAEDLTAFLPHAEGPEDDCIRKDMVRRLICHLAPADAEVVARRYGLTGPEETYEEIARDFNVTRERVRQRELRGLRVMAKRAKIIGATP